MQYDIFRQEDILKTYEKVTFKEAEQFIDLQGDFGANNLLYFPKDLDPTHFKITLIGSAKNVVGSRLLIKSDKGCPVIGIGRSNAKVIVGENVNARSLRLRLWSNASVFIGDNVYVGQGVAIVDNGEVSIDSGCLFSAEIVLQAGDQHGIIDLIKGTVTNRNYSKIIIGERVWLGRRVIVLAGAEIGAGSVIGAGALVKKLIPKCSLAVGIPAEVIKSNYSWTYTTDGPTKDEIEWFHEMGYHFS